MLSDTVLDSRTHSLHNCFRYQFQSISNHAFRLIPTFVTVFMIIEEMFDRFLINFHGFIQHCIVVLRNTIYKSILIFCYKCLAQYMSICNILIFFLTYTEGLVVPPCDIWLAECYHWLPLSYSHRHRAHETTHGKIYNKRNLLR